MPHARPTWKLKGRKLPLTRPAASLNRIDAIDRAVSHQRPYERREDVADFITSALAYHVEAAADAYVALAARLASEGIAGHDGWDAEIIAGNRPGAVEFMLTRAGSPGGYHVSIRAQPVLVEEASALRDTLWSRINAELDELGIPTDQRIMRAILGADIPTESETQLADLVSDPRNYRPVAPGDILESLIVVAVDIDGPPAGVEPHECNAMEDLVGADVGEGYLKGRQVEVTRLLGRPAGEMFKESSLPNIGGSAEVVMPVLSGLLRSNGLQEQVEARNAQISRMSWKCFGTDAGAAVSEAAHACVSASRGFFDDGVLEDIHRFARGIACHDISRQAEDFLALANALIAEGHVDQASEFATNDLRDRVHVEQDGGVLSLFNRSENGTYRLDMGLDEDGDAVVLEAFTISAPDKPCIGRFHREGGAWREDFAGDVILGDGVEQNIRNQRNLNNMISSLASLACVLQDEMKLRKGAPAADVDPSGP